MKTDFIQGKIKMAMDNGDIKIKGDDKKIVEFSLLIDTFSPTFNVVTP